MATAGGTRKFGEKRDAILHAASILINQQGVQATTLSEVARAIGLNATSVTYYFSRKDALIAAVYDATLDRLEDIASTALAEPDPAARIRSYIGALIELRLRFRRGERGLMTALSEVRTLDAELQDPLIARFRGIVALVRRFFGEPRTEAEARIFSARANTLIEAMLWWPVWSMRYSMFDFSRIADRLFDILAYGLPANNGTWQPAPLTGDWRKQDGEQPSQNTEFLRAATMMINQRGYRGASVSRIAESLNVTKGSFYHHHDAKDDLVLACFERSHDRLSAVQLASVKVDGLWWQRISSTLAELLDIQFFDEMPLLRTTALQALAGEHKLDVVTRSNRLARRFAGMLSDGIADGSVRAIDPLIASQVIMSTLNGAYEARRWAERFGDPQRAIATYASVLSKGLLAPVELCGTDPD